MADTFLGDSGNNTLNGTPNADLILGFQGKDTINGNGGSDTIYGGQGADSIQFGAFSFADYFGNATSPTLDTGAPLVYGGEGADTIIGGETSGNVTIVGDTGNISTDSASGGSDFIYVTGDKGSDLILGNYGDDKVYDFYDTVGGGFGSPTQTDTISGGFGNDSIGVNNDKADLVFGNQGNDYMYVYGTSNTLVGGMGNDTLITVAYNPQDAGQPVANRAVLPSLVYGGEGNDIVVLDGGNNTVLGGTGIASIDSLAGASGDGNDSIVVANDEYGRFSFGNDLLLGNYGDDTIDASGQLASTSNMDTLVGGQGNDVIFAGATANNIILGNQGNDAIADTLSSASGTDTIYGGMGNDTILVGDSVTATTGGDTHKDLVYGNEGNNSISVVGGGNDTIYGGNTANDAVGNGDGNNIINITSQVSGNDLIFGGSSNDSINNGSTSTTLFETVTGGAGADVFRFANAAATSVTAGTNAAAGTASGNDVITDMTSGIDKIAATGNPISNFSNIGSVTGTSLNAAAAAAEAILTRQYGAGTNAATFTYQGSTDTYAVVATSAGAGTAETTNLLVDIKATTSLVKGDFIA